MTSHYLINLLGATGLAVKDALDRTASSVTGLQGEAPAALLTIGTRPGRPIEDLRRALDLSHSGTVRLVARLQRRDWVKRVAAKDGREVRLHLTGAGEVVVHRLLAARRAALEVMLAAVPEEDRPYLKRGLSRLLGKLASTREQAWHVCRLCEHGVCRGESCPVGSAVGDRDAPP